MEQEQFRQLIDDVIANEKKVKDLDIALQEARRTKQISEIILGETIARSLGIEKGDCIAYRENGAMITKIVADVYIRDSNTFIAIRVDGTKLKKDGTPMVNRDAYIHFDLDQPNGGLTVLKKANHHD